MVPHFPLYDPATPKARGLSSLHFAGIVRLICGVSDTSEKCHPN